MATVMTNSEFIKKLKDIAQNYKTLYVMGCFGAPMTDQNKARYANNCAYNRKSERTKMIQAASSDTFGFDCVCLIKGILWGWKGDKADVYGGAKYASSGVPDISADQMIGVCASVSTDFAKIEPGEAVWLPGHIGVYIGDGLAVECSPAFANKVQITAVGNVGKKSGYNVRTWQKHGKLPYIDYVQPETSGTYAPGTRVRLKDGSAINDGAAAAANMSCVKIWSYKDGKYFVCTTGWDGGAQTAAEHAIGWVAASAVEPWSWLFSVGQLVKYWGGKGFSSLNGAASGDPACGAWTVAQIIDRREGEHPYQLRDTHTGVVMGWVDERRIGAYTRADVDAVTAYVRRVEFSEDQVKIYDLDGDGVVTEKDLEKLNSLVN